MMDIEKKNEIDFSKIYGDDKYKKWVKAYPIFKNKDVEAWIRDMIDQFTDEGKEPQKFLIQSYLKSLHQYCIYNQTDDPSNFLKEDVDTRNLRFKKYIMFLMNVKDEDPMLKKLGFRNAKSPSEVTIRNGVQAKIKSFYSNRGVPITYKLKTVKSGANINELVLNKNCIKLIQAKLESVNYRLICKFESQTGLRISDILEEIPSGKYKIEKYQEHYFIRNFRTQKEMVTINYLFFTQELTELIQSAIGETDLTKLDLTTLFQTRQGNKINSINYLERLKLIVDELGLNGNIKTHGLRKYFTTQLSKGAKKLEDDRIILHLEGREAPYRDQAYLTHIKDIDYYYREWKKIETDICVDCVVYDNTNKKIVKLEQEILDLKQQKEIVQQDNLVLKQVVDELRDNVDMLGRLYFYNVTKDEFPDIELDKSVDIAKIIKEEYKKLLKKK
ncbi:MAG: tyrosine-type recombinase/integrase [Candidatus Odinarchaeota archaeon]